MISTEPTAEPAEPSARPPASTQRVQPIQLPLPFSWPPLGCSSERLGAPKFPPRSAPWQPLGRCREKGCVFPAVDSQGRCLQHQRQWCEPVFYSSHQPSSALIEQGRFGDVRLDRFREPKAGHAYDRRRMAAEREEFLVEPK